MTWSETFNEMKSIYAEGIDAAVRSQRFIKVLHRAIALEIEERLTEGAKREGVTVAAEAKLHGSFKDKDVDIAVIHPVNGPLILCGVRSQMSSIAKNILTYSQDIMGEAVSLQDRFPMTVFGYCYLLPLKPHDTGNLDVTRYSKIFGSMSARAEASYKHERGRYDHFAFAVVDFETNPPTLREDLVTKGNPKVDLSLSNLSDRLIETFNQRNPWLDYFN
jgi:hypothetical protein